MKRTNNGNGYYGTDGLIHDAYGDNQSNHRVGGLVRVYPYWYQQRKKKSANRKPTKRTDK